MTRVDVSNDRVVALVAGELLSADPDALDAAIARAFEQVGRHRDVERAFYYRLDDDRGVFELAHEWHVAALGSMRAIERYARLSVAVLPAAFMDALRGGAPIALPRTRGALAAPIGQLVSADGDRALVMVPVLLDGGLLGVAGFSAARESAWGASDVELLTLVSQGVARAALRQRAEVERRELLARADASRAEAEASRAETAAIVCRISDAFVALDREGRCRFVNDRAVALLGRPREALIGEAFWTQNGALAGEPVREAFRRALETQQPVTVEAPSGDGARVHEVRVYPSPTGASVFAEDVTLRKRREEELANDREYLTREMGGAEPSPDLVGFGEGLRELLERASLVAATSTTVLITGETGTGKELVARAIHDRSPRRERLLVKVNCAAISAGLVESELFGHEKGAFTGALARRKGRFELAHGGTLFLDEVGELPLELQAKLLRVLQERELERVGGTETVRVDVRVVAATNRNLPDMVARGAFREDLYYRLAVFPLALPPLRERPRDVPVLVHALLRRFAREAGKRITAVSPEAMRALADYRWPGNVRELQNVVERAVILARGDVLGIEALPTFAAEPAGPAPVVARGEASADGGRPSGTLVRIPGKIDEAERDFVARTLSELDWVIEGEHGAARRLGLHPNTLRSRLKRWGLRRPEAHGRLAC
jgi:formate hydrogenlyase transcriptional activator